MAHFRLFLVACGAPLWSHLPDFPAAEIVTRRARHFLFEHVYFVTQNAASDLPLFGDINPVTPLSWPGLIRRTGAHEKKEKPKQREHHHSQG